MIKKLAEQLKRKNKKRGINIALGTVVGFLLSTGIVYGETIDNPISSSTEYTEDKVLEMNGKQIISTGNGEGETADINIDATGHRLELNHETSDTVDMGWDSSNPSASIFAKTGNLDIKADELILNSNFTGVNSGVGVLAYKEDGDGNTKKILLEAKEIEMTITEGAEKNWVSGIESRGEGAEVEIQGNLKLEVNSQGSSTGLRIIQGEINIENDITHITLNSAGSSTGLSGTGGKINIDSKTFILDVKGEEGGRAEGAYINSSNLNINTENMKMNVVGSGVIGIESSNNKFNINNKEVLEIVVENVGELKNAIGILDGGEPFDDMRESGVIINSGNTIINIISEGKTTAIATVHGGKVEINGGLEIYQTGTTTTSVLSDFYGLVELNKNNEAVAVKINGQIEAVAGGTITLNLNGEDSYFIGRSYMNEYLEEGEIFTKENEINLGISNGAVWKNEDDSRVSSLKFDNGNIDMTYQADGQKIEIDKISGNNGKITMDISSADVDQTGGKTDFISIKDADTEQKHYIATGKDSLADLLNYDFADNILIGEASDKVKLEGSKFEEISNVYDYTLKLKEEEAITGGNNWYVTGVEKKESSTTETVIDDMSLNAGLARMEADTLHKRLGDVRDSKEGAGVWSRVTSGQMESDKNGYFKNDYTMIQAGIDKSETSLTGTWITGFAVQHREGKTDFRNGDGKNESTGVSLYKSWLGNEDQYLDLVGKYSHIKNEYKSYNSKNEKTEADYHTNAGTLSLEYGKRISKNKWYLQPHVQTTYTWIEGKNYTTSSDMRVEQKDTNSLIGKAGIYAGYDFERSSHFIKMGVLHEFMGDYGATIKGKDTSINKNIDGKDTWVELGIGGDIKIGKTGSTNVYYEIEKTFGGDFETNWQASLGIRYKF